jgi:hypothetical protein
LKQVKILLSPQLGYWVGANDRYKEGKWEWNDLTPTVLLRKMKGNEGEKAWRNDCGAIYADKDLLQDDYCYQKKGFICKKVVK